MEVNNPMMDQLLVNTAPQVSANTKAPKDADSPDFDSMVHQRRTADKKAETKETKDAKQAKPDGAPETKEEAKAEEPAVADAQYAIAAAAMFQAQPDTRYTMVTSGDAEALPRQAIEAVQAEQAGAVAVEQPETPEAEPENLAGPETEVRSVAVEAPREEKAPTQQETKADAAAPETGAREARQTEQAPRQAEQAPRTEHARAEDAPRTNRAENPAQRHTRTDAVETGDVRADDARFTQAAPLFARVDAPVVKVAEVSHPIPLEAEGGVEQLGEELGGMLVNSADVNRVEVTLTPEHLGKLTIEISRGENGALSVVLHASSERAANLLERGAGSLQSMLAANARSDVQVEVRPAGESQQQFLNPDGQNGQEQQQQQQQQNGRRDQQSAQDFLQQLRLGLVDNEENAN